MSTLGFFLSRSHIGRVSRFRSKIGAIAAKSGWLNSLIVHDLWSENVSRSKHQDLWLVGGGNYQIHKYTTIFYYENS